MARLKSRGRSSVLAVLLTALVLAAEEQPNFTANYTDGVKALQTGHYPEARKLLAAAYEQATAFPPDDVRRAVAAHALATIYQFQGQHDRASALFLEAKRILETQGPSPQLASILDGLGELRFEQGRWTEAEALLNQAVSLDRRLRGEKDPFTMIAAGHLGELYSAQGRMKEGEALLQQAIEVFRTSKSVSTETLAITLEGLARAYIIEGRYAQAEPLLQEALELNRKLGDMHPALADSLLALGTLYRVEGDRARAEPLLKKAARIYEAAGDPHLGAAISELGVIAIQEGKYAIAREALTRTIAIFEKSLGRDHPTLAMAQARLAEAYLGERNFAEAQPLIERSLAVLRRSLGESHFELAGPLLIAARIEAQQHHTAAADSYYRQALNVYRQTLAGDHPQLAMAERQYQKFSKSLRK